MAFTTASLAQAREMAARAKQSIKDWKADNATRIGRVVAGGEAAVTAGAFGWVNSRFANNEDGDAVTIGGVVPIDFLAGAGLHVLAFMNGLEDDQAPHVAAVGTGALSACAYRIASSYGRTQKAAAEAAKNPPALAAAAPPAQLYAPQAHAPAQARVIATPNGQQFSVVQHP